jgi:hypothetical protein
MGSGEEEQLSASEFGTRVLDGAGEGEGGVAG